jgi:eukaryotic-like serine/threonine-protein kinase
MPTGAPERVGRYEILLPIASGGMATVYLARAVGVGGFTTEVALKLTHAHLRENPEFSNDLVEEAKIAARIRHRNVVSVIDVGEAETGIFLVLEYVEGDSLSGLFKAGAIPRAIAARFLLDALEGLHAAHELRDDAGALLGVVHRDFTPHNILIGTDGVARLADFGIAKAATRLGNTRLGMVKGKVAYMPPEQARGMPLDRRCDVWAAGVVAWELLANRRLYVEDDEVAILLKVATEAPPRLSSVAPDVPAALSDAVAHALTMDVEKRCATAAVLARELRAALSDCGGVAETSVAAEWVNFRIGARVSDRRLHAAEVRQRREQTVVSMSVPQASPTVTESLRTEPQRRKEPTVALPTRVLPEPDGKPTDAVSVVGKVPAPAVPLAGKRLGLVAAGVGSMVVLVGLAVWELSAHPNDTTPAAIPSVHADPVTSSASSTPTPPRAPLHVHANAPLAWLQVDGRSVPLTAGATDVDVDLGSVAPGTALTVDAASVDARRASLMIASDAPALSVDFPAPATYPAAVRPAPAPRPTSRTAPLAPSPYP